VVIQREYLLNALGPAATAVVEHFQGPANLVQARIGRCITSPLTAANAVEDGGQVEQLAAGFQEISVKGFGSRYWGHGSHARSVSGSGVGMANRRLLSTLTSTFKLPERKPSRSRVTYWNPNSLRRRTSPARHAGSARRGKVSAGTSTRASSPSCRRTRHSR